MGALYGAFAGVLNEDISGFLLEDPLISFESLVKAVIPGYTNEEIVIPWVLQKFDMPQVYQALCPRKVTLLNPYSGDKNVAGESEVYKLDRIVAVTYRSMGEGRAWSIQRIEDQNKASFISTAFLE